MRTDGRAQRGRAIARLACLALAFASVAPLAAERPASAFQAFVASLRPEAERRGVPAALFDATFAGMTPDPGVAAMTLKQPEFVKPIGAYLAAQVTPARIARGRALAARWHAELAAIAKRYEVPPSIIVAVWGLETSYGAATGSKDVIRSLATLAAMNYRPELYRAEILAALDMLKAGDVSRERLRGSWAGAMGQPQFMPSSFENYAVDGDGDGRRDIWTDVPDALASIANFIRAKGWQPGRPWGFEVSLPRGFDYHVARADARTWASLGVRRADGAPIEAKGELILFFPAGAAGPAFLVTENFEVLKTYNSSDAYVLSVAQLADRMEGGSAIAARWPTDIPMSRDDRIALQTRLVALGYPVDDRQGRISLALRDTIRSAQASVGMVPDGDPTTALLEALRTATRRP